MALKKQSLLLSLFLVGLLYGCGFTPLYSEQRGQSAKSLLNTVEISIIPDRSGQFLRNDLIDRFYVSGYPTNPQYVLSISPIGENIYDFDITVESEATRRQVRLSATMNLIDQNTKQSVLQRSLTGITSYNVLESEYSTLVTEQSARESALNELARQIEQQITLYLKRTP